MSKVYSFRLNDDNPREAQARAVIEYWGRKGVSLRYLIVDALIIYKKEKTTQGELSSVVEQLQDLILSLDKTPVSQPSEATLSHSFLDAVKKSVRAGVKNQGENL